MSAVEQVAPGEVELEMVADAEGEAAVRLDIVADARDRLDGADPAQTNIELEPVGEIHLGAREQLIFGVVAEGIALGEIDAAGLELEILPQGREAEIEPPPGRQLAAAPRLDAVAIAFESVAQLDRQRIARELGRADVIVEIEEGRDGEGRPRCRLAAIAGLECDQLLGIEIIGWSEQRQVAELPVDP